jgi:hypothetical protein
MSNLENQFVLKHHLDQLSSTDHSLRRYIPDSEPKLAQRETWLDEVDPDELYYEGGISVTRNQITPEDVDAV